LTRRNIEVIVKREIRLPKPTNFLKVVLFEPLLLKAKDKEIEKLRTRFVPLVQILKFS
jgi:hypothetical protein